MCDGFNLFPIIYKTILYYSIIYKRMLLVIIQFVIQTVCFFILIG